MATLIRMLAGETVMVTVPGSTPRKLVRFAMKAPRLKVSTVPCATTANLILVCRLAPGASGGGAGGGEGGGGEGGGGEGGGGDGGGDGGGEGGGGEGGGGVGCGEGGGEGGGGEGEGGGGEGEGKVTVTRASDLHVDTHCCAKLPEAGSCKKR